MDPAPTQMDANALQNSTNRLTRPLEDRDLDTKITSDGMQASETSSPGLTLSSMLRYADTPLGRFLNSAVVWLVRPPGVPRPIWRVPSNDIVPPGHQVHSLDAFLMACGWSTTARARRHNVQAEACTWAERGVLFVNEADEVWIDSTLKRLLGCRTTLLKEHKIGRVKSKGVQDSLCAVCSASTTDPAMLLSQGTES